MENEDLTETAKNIVSQAQNWSFEGDCLILQYMEEISQNLESRVTEITESVEKITKKLGRAEISLENTQNSLNALQYTQYVEMRCQEDDLPSEPEKDKDEVDEKPRPDLLKVFLENNLKMLHNCHEKFDFTEESDDEDTDNLMAGENCIYQPRNPYNERLLPHIYGTKLWKENWHVGLCEDSSSNYSGDEASDAYSLSASSSSRENISLESHYTENISEWTSNTSLNVDKTTTSSKIDNHIPLPMPPIPIAPNIPPLPDLIKTQIVSKSNENIEDRTISNDSKETPLQYKKVNLFDDKDFKSLMSEITHKVQAKNASITVTPRKQSNSIVATPNEPNSTDIPKFDLFASRSNSPKEISKVDLFAERSSSSPPTNNKLKSEATTTSTSHKKNLFDSPTDEYPTVQNSRYTTKKHTVNLFEDLDNSTYDKDDFVKDLPPLPSHPKEKNTMISAKSLFDDDDDGDDDFLNVFGKFKTSVESSSKSEIPVSDTNTVVTKTTLSSSLFGNSENDEIDFIFTKTNRPIEPEGAGKYENRSFDQDVVVDKVKNIFLDDSEEESDSIFTGKNQKTEKAQPKDTEKKFEVVKKDEVSTKEDFHIVSNVTTASNKTKTIIPAFIETEPPKELEDQFPTTKSKGNDIREEISGDDFVSTPKVAEPNTIKKVGILGADHFDDLDEDIIKTNAARTDIEIDSTHSPATNDGQAEAILNNPATEANTFYQTDSDDVSMNDETTSQNITTETKEVSEIVKDNKSHSKDPPDTVPYEKKERSEGMLNYVHTETIGSSTLKDSLWDPKDQVKTNEEKDDDCGKQAPNDSAKALKFDSFSPLFLDEPPDDDDFFQVVSSVTGGMQSGFESDFFETTKDIPKTSNDKSNIHGQKSQSYDIGLFCEFPPEDNGSIDDFLKPIATVQSMKSTTHEVGTHGIPQAGSSYTDPINEAPKETVKRESPKKDQERLIPSKDTVNNTKQETPRRANVSKLKMPSININVNALLPNAIGNSKKINIDSPMLSNESRSATEFSSSSTQDEASPRHQHLEAGLENILSSLCKNRVRGPLKRRASTRAGRKANYRETLKKEEENQSEDHPPEILESRKLSKDIGNRLSSVTLIEKPYQPLNSKEENMFVRPPADEKPSSLIPTPISEKTNIHDQPFQTSTTVRTVSNFLDDFDDSESNDDFFKSIIKPRSPKGIAQKDLTQSSKLPLPTNSDSDDELFRKPMLNTKAKLPANDFSKPTESLKGATSGPTKEQPLAKKLDMLFASDSNDDDDELFRNLSKPSQKVVEKAASNAPLVDKGKSKSLFSDSEDDDDLFGKSTVKSKKVDTKKNLDTPTKTPTSNSMQQSSRTKAKEKAKAPITKTTDNPLADLLGS